MYGFTDILKEFTELARIENDPETKRYLITTISELVNNNYDVIQVENSVIDREMENIKYKNYLNAKLINVTADIRVLENEFNNDRDDGKFSVLGLDPNNGITDYCNSLDDDKVIKYSYLMKELEYLNSELHALEYPIYTQEETLNNSINSRLQKLEEFVSSKLGEDGCEDEKFKDIFRYINELKDNEYFVAGRLDQIRNNCSSIADVEDSVDLVTAKLEYLNDKCETMEAIIEESNFKSNGALPPDSFCYKQETVLPAMDPVPPQFTSYFRPDAIPFVSQPPYTTP